MFKVLVVDDSNSIIIFMSRLLKNKFDCYVLTAGNGLEALSILEDEEVDIIFLDITMPIMNGVETLQAIRQNTTLKDIPVIILSSVADKDIIDKVKELKINSYMLKPLTYDTAYKTIRKIFDKINADKKNANSFEALLETEIDGRKKIVIIDPDENFKEQFRINFSEKYIIFDSDSGPKGLNIILKEKPDYIFLAENLSFLSEIFIAKKIKNLSEPIETVGNHESYFNLKDTQLYLMKDSRIDYNIESELQNLSEDEKTLFDEVFIKTDEPHILLKGLTKALKF